MKQKAMFFDKQISEFLLEFKKRFNPIQPYIKCPASKAMPLKSIVRKSLQCSSLIKFHTNSNCLVAQKFSLEIVFDT